MGLEVERLCANFVALDVKSRGRAIREIRWRPRLLGLRSVKGVYTGFRGQLRFVPTSPMSDAKRTSGARRPTRILVPLTVVALILGAAPLLAGGSPPGVHGKVIGWEKLVSQTYVDATRLDAHGYTWREPSPTVKQEFRKLTANVSRDVCVVALGAGGAQPHEPIVVKVTGGRATPSTQVLAPGSRLSFQNQDPFEHVLYEVNNPAWGPSATAPKSSREWMGTTPGRHVIRDQFFPSIVMYVVIDPAAIEVSMPDRDGAFSMTLPTGDYTFKAFFEGKQVGKDVTPLHVIADRGIDLHDPLVLGGDSK